MEDRPDRIDAGVPVSIVLYVHNGARYLTEALVSILDQTHRHFELCVVDDGSTDATSDIVRTAAARDPRIRLETQDAHGRERLHETFNNALAMTRHDLIAIANADDVWRRDKLERQVAVFAAEPGLDVCHHDAVFIDDHGLIKHGEFRNTPSPYVLRDVRPWHFVAGNPIPNPTVMFHRSILLRVGLQEVGDMHDHQFWFKAAAHGCSFLGLPDRLIRYRIHEESHSTASGRQERIREAHGESVAMMLERLALEEVVPELTAVDASDPRNRAWTHQFLAGLLWPRHLAMAEQQFRAALREFPDPGVKCGLAMALAQSGDRYRANALLRDAAAAGVRQADFLRRSPDLLLDMATPPWHGSEPPIAGVVRGKLDDAVVSAEREHAVVEVALSLPDAPVSAASVAEAMHGIAVERGAAPTRVMVLATTATIDSVVAAYDLFREGVPAIVDALDIEARVLHDGATDAVAAAYQLEGAEVLSLDDARRAVCVGGGAFRPEPALTR